MKTAKEIFNEVDQERIEQIANLRAAKELANKARFETVHSDGEDIFNAVLDEVDKWLGELIGSIE